MTPDRLRECLALLGWSQHQLARMTGRQEGAVRMWARGRIAVEPAVAAWLERWAGFAAAHPPPPAREEGG